MKNTETRLIKSLSTPISVSDISIHGHRVHFATGGKGRDLLLIHGGNIGWGEWYLNFDYLAKYFRVTAIDMPGSGRSSGVDYRVMDIHKDFYNVIVEFIRKRNLEKADVLGTSIGGWVALKLAIENKIKGKLIVANAIGFTDDIRISDKIIGIFPLATFLSKTVLKPTPKNMDMFIRDVFYNKDIVFRPEFFDYFVESMERSHNILFISRLAYFFQKKSLSIQDDLHDIKNKALIIWGDKDTLLPLDKNQSKFNLVPHARVKVINDAGHIPLIEKADEFNSAVLSFLK